MAEISEPQAAAAEARRGLPKRTAFFVALLSAPVVVGGFGLGLIALAESLRFAAGAGDVIEAMMAVGVVMAYSVPFGAVSYFLVGGVLFWLKQRRGATRTVDFVITGFIANFLAALIAVPLLAIFGLLAGENNPVSLGALSLLVHGFGLIFAPLYGMIFGFVFTRTARDLGHAQLKAETVEAVFR